uniref:Integrase catalytic domain-containing protein n=1 Tax=Fagus sylvatica TaxID=28930 RepID=A0A2N9FLZ7_FAGSY
MAEETSKLRGLEARVAALETKFDFLLQFMRRWTEREEEKKKATISKRQKEIYPALSLSKAAQTLPTPRRPAFHIPRPSRTEPRQFQPLPIPVLQLYALLIKKKMITPVNQRTRIGPQPKDYNKDLTCEYHQGEVGHTVENCRVLRHRIQDLLDQGVLKFRIEGVINTIGAEKDEEVDITSTKIPWEPLFHELKKRGLLPAPRAPKESTEAGTCQYHPGARDHNLQGCEEFKKEVAGLITKGLIRRRGEQPERDCMTIDQLRLSPYEKTNFQARMERIEEDFEKFCERKKEGVGETHTSHTTGNVRARSSGHPLCYQRKGRASDSFGIRGSIFGESSKRGDPSSATLPLPRQSGRCYTPEELEKRRKEAGKAVEDPTKTKAVEEEAADFLRIIKSSEYSIVKQLSKMPSHISVLSLLLASESHRKALLKVLNEAYVPEDITGPSFENMVTSILVTNQLTFSDDELPPEGRGHTKALYISVKTNDRVVSRVLIDNGMVVRAFDGTRREVLGEIDLPVEIGPQVYDINFQVLRIDSPYNLLLGRPWLHTAGAVPSSLHQKMKLIIGNQLVTILAEEPISIYNDGEIPYIDGCAPEEASFHSFEFVTVIHRVAAVEPRLSKAGIMVAKEFVKAGFQPGQEGIVRWPMKPGGKELQRSSKERNGLKGRIAIPHIRTTFPASAMFQVDEGDVDELALLFTEDLNVNAITTEGDSAAFPVHADQHEEIDLEDFLDEENLKGYRIDEETLDEDTWEDDDLPDLLPHLMVPRGLDTLEFEIFCEHGDPESHLRKVRGHLVLSAEESCLLGRFGEELSWTDTATTSRHHQAIITTTTAEEEDAGPMVEGLSIHTITEEEDSTTTHHRPATANREKKPRRGLACHCYSVSQVAMKPREVKIGTRCAAEQKEALIALLREFHEIFAWSYQDMPGLDTDIVVHKIPLKPECKPVKASTATDEARTNIVPVPKKDGKVRMCVDYRDLNRASPKDNFPLPHIDTLVDNTATNVVFSFMDGFSGTPGATYQRAMVTLFHDMIHHEIECAFGVTSGKLLGFIVSGRGIEIDPAKVQAIRSMPAPKTEKEIRSFLGRINYIARFIAQLTATCEPLFKLLRKDVKIKWTEDCQKAFDKIKEYLLNPPILVPPTPGRPLILYLTVQEASMGCMLGQQDETGKKEQAIYYLSKKFTEPETRYLLVEEDVLRTGLGLQEAETVHALLHHLVGIPDGPDQVHSLKSLPLTGKIARWQVLLSEFDILFVARKAIKGQAIADYLADYPSEQLELMDSRVPRRRPNAVGSGIGAVLVSPKGQQTPIAVKLGFDCTNNMTEYEACIVGLQAALEFGAYELEVFGDSLLIVSQTNGEWQARDPKLIPYQRYISRLSPKVQTISLGITISSASSKTESIHHGRPKMRRKYIRRMAFQFFLSGEILYKRTHDATLLRCVDAEEANRLIQEMHAGLMGAHANGPFLARKIMRAGYYWLTMERDCIRHVQTCHKCQMYQNSKNAPPQYLHTMASPWPFSAWGMDVIGAITPKASNGHEFILVAIDYFTKWVEACSFKNVTQVAVTRFVKNNIICRYGMPEMLITDNASNLNNRMMDQLCQQFKIQHHNSAPYRPKMNGAVEAANKNVKKILSKMTETYKDWHEHLPYALCAYRTWKKPNGPKQARYEQLNFIDEKRLAALCHGQLYQRRIERAYNKKARPRTFQPGDLVLKKRNMALSDPRGKFAPSYEGPYVVKKAFSGGAIILADMDGEEFRSPINSDSVIKYHV